MFNYFNFLVLFVLLILPTNVFAEREWQVTGFDVPELSSFDTQIKNFMLNRNISGGALAVTRDSKLVLAHGYTYTDNNQDVKVQPNSLFRIASCSKPLTALGILRLVQEGRLNLSDKLTDILTLKPPHGQTVDLRLMEITVKNLLQHLGGWDRDISFDPMLYDYEIASALNLSLPISKSDIITYMTGQSLQHTPGTTYAYSNYGYCLLGRIIENITGQSYNNYIIKQILNPLGITQMRLGHSQREFQQSSEVTYHSMYSCKTVFDDAGGFVPCQYGGFNLENMDSHGGWLASAIDLVRFASIFDSSSENPILNQASIDTMFALPENIDPSQYNAGDFYYACGWAVRDFGNNYRNTWHVGSLPGTYTLMVRRGDGVDWVVLFNQRDDYSGLSYDDIDWMLHNAADAVSAWPQHDLFSEYLSMEKKGDIDDDGNVNLQDAIIALKVLSGVQMIELRDDYITSNVDVNMDRKIGIEEVIYILKKYL